MPLQRDRLYLVDVLTAADAIRTGLDGIDRDAFERSDWDQAAVLFKLTVIGEACNKLSTELKERHPDIPWRQIIGLRNFIVHRYHGIDNEVVWTAAVVHVPELAARISQILEALDGTSSE